MKKKKIILYLHCPKTALRYQNWTLKFSSVQNVLRWFAEAEKGEGRLERVSARDDAQGTPRSYDEPSNRYLTSLEELKITFMQCIYFFNFSCWPWSLFRSFKTASSFQEECCSLVISNDILLPLFFLLIYSLAHQELLSCKTVSEEGSGAWEAV